MSVREIIGGDGKIENRYLPTTNIPTLSTKQLLTGNSSNDYVVIGGNQQAGTILAATANGLQWQAGSSIQLTRGQLITSDGTSTIALPYPGSPADGFRLEIDPDVTNPTGLRWASVTDAIEEEAPMSGEAVTGNPGKLSIAINYAAGAAGQGQIPVGINFPTGRRGTLLNKGPVGTCLTVANGSGSQDTGLVWANPPVSSVTATATSNITVTSPSTNNYSVALANPLNNNVSLADKNISGTTGNITFLDTVNATTSVLSATNLSVSSTSAGTTSAFLNDLGVTMNSGSSATTLSANGISKTGNNSALVLNHAFSAGNINLQTNSGIVTTNCPLQPTSIKDSAGTPSTGTANQVLTAGPSGNSLVWVTPTVPPAATLTSVLTAGNVNNSGNNLNMNSKLIQNVSSPSAAGDAANKTYVDSAVTGVSRTLTQVLSAGNSAGTSTINMNSNKITSLAAPTDGNDAANKTYVDGRPIPVPYTAQGQIQYAGPSPTFTPTNLPIGTNGQVLTSNGTTVTWAVPSSVSVATAKCATFGVSYTTNVAFGNITATPPGPGATLQIPFGTVVQSNSNDNTITFGIDGTGKLQYTGPGQVVVNVYANLNYVTEQTQNIFPLPSGPFVPIDFVTPPGGGGSAGQLVNSNMITTLVKTSTSETVARCATGASNFQFNGVYNSNLSGTFVMNQNDTVIFQAFSNSIWNAYGFPGQTRFLFSALPTTSYPLSDFNFTAFRLS